jgi:hypothetical protein
MGEPRRQKLHKFLKLSIYKIEPDNFTTRHLMATVNLFSLQAAASGNRGAAATNRVVQTGYVPRVVPRFPRTAVLSTPNLAPADCCPVQRWAIEPERARDARFQRANDCSSDVRPGVQPSARFCTPASTRRNCVCSNADLTNPPTNQWHYEGNGGQARFGTHSLRFRPNGSFRVIR